MTIRGPQDFDPVDRPKHYNSHPSGIETVVVTEHMSAMLGSAIKYVWRRGMKGDAAQDLMKAAWCFDREAARLDEIPGARPWDSELWRVGAREVVRCDQTILGDILRDLLRRDDDVATKLRVSASSCRIASGPVHGL